MTKLKPFDNMNFRRYSNDVIAWHGYIKLLGMPSIQTNRDISIQELYVGQSVSNNYLSTDHEPEKDYLQSPTNLLVEHHRLVILGDPGSGKSTLVNYLSWVLAKGLDNKLPEQLQQALPVPIILRELPLSEVNSFEELIQAFLNKPVAKALNDDVDLFWQFVTNNRVLFLIDGLDEVSSHLRKHIVKIIKTGFEQYSEGYFIITSRIVGYEQMSLTYRQPKTEIHSDKQAYFYQQEKHPLEPHQCYVAPFTSNQVNQFAKLWYAEHSGEAQHASKDFIDAINATETTQALARTPNLLAMMAMIYKVRVRLPNGRAMLYEDIAQAYLESIDTARKMSDPIPWRKKKLWLARIGFEMQLRRSANLEGLSKKELREQDDTTLLADKCDIYEWLKKAMQDSGEQQVDEQYIENYIQWIIRRSGLLIPRGEDQFAFMHLSFQEYFAAVHIKAQLENPSWFDDDEDLEDDDPLDTRINKEALSYWGNQLIWKQTIIALFELFHDKAGWSNRLWKYCFKKDAEELLMSQKVIGNLAKIFGPDPSFLYIRIELLANQHVNISRTLKIKTLQVVSELAIKQASKSLFQNNTFISKLLSYDTLNSDLIECFELNTTLPTLSSIGIQQIDNNNLNMLGSILQYTPKLKNLSLEYFSTLSPFNILTNINLANLESISLGSFSGNDISPLNHFTNLTTIYIDAYDNLKDYSPLSLLPNLEVLIIDGESIIDNPEYNFDGIDRNIILTGDEYIEKYKPT